MTVPDYIPYTADEYQPDAPAGALHFARWFQNWEAGFGGAAGAPRLADGAHPTFAAGDVVLLNVLGGGVERAIGGTTYSEVFSWHPMVAGSWRVKVNLIRDAVGVNANCRVTLNGSVVATLTQASGSWAQFSTDVSASPGDCVSVLVANSAAGSNRFRNLLICADRRGVFRV